MSEIHHHVVRTNNLKVAVSFGVNAVTLVADTETRHRTSFVVWIYFMDTD